MDEVRAGKARETLKRCHEKHREERLAKMRQYRLINIERLTARKKEYYAANREAILEKRKQGKFKPNYKEMRRRNSKAQQVRLREQMISAYGGRCECCGEDYSEFLTLDHKDGRGSHHRNEVGSNVYRMLRRQGWPKDKYRLLCMNCNFSYGMRGYCPHQHTTSMTFALAGAIS